MSSEFSTFLSESRVVDETKVKYYVYWVKGYLVYCGHDLSRMDRDSEQAYLRELEADGKESWQLQQAEHAILLYRDEFLGKYQADKRQQIIEDNWDSAFQRMREIIRMRHYSLRTEKTYLSWSRRFKVFIAKNRPSDLTEKNIRDYLNYLAVTRNVAASTQNQAFNSLLFLCREVLKMELGNLNRTVRAKQQQRLPVVLTREELEGLFNSLDGHYRLMAMILYGCGLRLRECLKLRIHDIDIPKRILLVRSGKGDKDRTTILPDGVVKQLELQIQYAKEIFSRDQTGGIGTSELPYALERKYPNAPFEWQWQYLFPAKEPSIDPRTGIVKRHHIFPSSLQRVIKDNSRQLGIPKKVNCHALRHSFATHLLESGTDIRTIQELLGHSNVNTTMVYTHVASKRYGSIQNPLDEMTF